MNAESTPTLVASRSACAPEQLAARAEECHTSFGIIYGLDAAAFVVVDNGTLLDGFGQTVDPATLYEARFVTNHGELRWTRDRASGTLVHQQVVGSDAEQTTTSDESMRIVCVGRAERSYLLWGRRQPAPASLRPGWSVLTAGRIGSIAVPVPTDESHPRIRWNAVEFLRQEPQHGNVVVADELLGKLVAATTKGTARDTEDSHG